MCTQASPAPDLPARLNNQTNCLALLQGWKNGSPQELVKCCILRGFPDLLKSHVFRVGDGHALGFQQQVAYVGVAAPAVDQHADIAVDGLDDSKAHLGAA